MLGLEFYAMGCQMQVLTKADHPKVTQGLSDLIVGFKQAEQRFSRFLSDSELMQLNQQRSLKVSHEFWQLLQHSLAAARLTQGLITPTIYQRLIQRGYTVSFDKLSKYQPSDSRINHTILADTGGLQPWQHMLVNDKAHEVVLLKDTKLDFGGFAKVLTAYDTAQTLAHLGTSVLIDAGGDIVTVGNDSATLTKPWQIALPSANDVTLSMDEGVFINKQTMNQLLINWQLVSQDTLIYLPTARTHILATSGIDYRYWYHGQFLQHHLVNPLRQDTKNMASDVVCASILIDEMLFHQNQDTFHPSIARFLQTSNVCNLAQTLSKLFCLLGLEKSLQWLNQHGLQALGVSVIIATPTGYQQWLNPTMQAYCTNDNNKEL